MAIATSQATCDDSKIGQHDQASSLTVVNEHHKYLLRQDLPIVMYHVPPTQYSINFNNRLHNQKIIVPSSKSTDTNDIHEIILATDSMLSD